MSFDPFRKYTQARIGLGHQAPAIPTKAWLQFAYHHACAVDAVSMPWKISQHQREIEMLGYACEIVTTEARHREDYLLRPDKGRTLSTDSEQKLQQCKKTKDDVVIVISNGLSSHAVANHVTPFLSLLLPKLAEKQRIAQPILLVENARVALIDHIGSLLYAKLGLIIIGERPGLSAPDSLAVYLTYQPQRGLTDASRNCISNLRPPFGLTYEAAVQKTCFLVEASLSRKISGIELKDHATSTLKSFNPSE